VRSWRRRAARTDDLLAIEGIEVASFGNPWLADVYAQELEREIGVVEVAESQDGTIVGVFCVWCVADESHLMRIATAPSRRREGIGRDLLEAALDSARSAGCEHMTLEVAASNEAAIELYAAAGFSVVGRRRGYYRAPPDDALLMRCELSADLGTCPRPRRDAPRQARQELGRGRARSKLGTTGSSTQR
jgi:[ribosomal protein S18]-alanine N-acetyltransferase